MGWYLQQQAKELDTVYELEYKKWERETTQAQLFKMIMAESVYTIWNERNKRIFEDKKCVIDEVVKRIAYVTIVRSSSTITNIICHRKI